MSKGDHLIRFIKEYNIIMPREVTKYIADLYYCHLDFDEKTTRVAIQNLIIFLEEYGEDGKGDFEKIWEEYQT